MDKADLIRKAQKLEPMDLTGTDAQLLSKDIALFVKDNLDKLSLNSDNKQVKSCLDELFNTLKDIRHIFVQKAEEYKRLRISEYEKVCSPHPIPQKHLDDIENRYKFIYLTLTGTIDIQEKLISYWLGDISKEEVEQADKMIEAELKKLILSLEIFEAELYKKHNSIASIKLHENKLKRAIHNKKIAGLEVGKDLENSLEHYQLLKEEIELTEKLNTVPNNQEKEINSRTMLSFKDSFKSESAYKTIYDWLKENDKINESEVFQIGQNEFVELIYALYYKGYLNQKPNSTQIIAFMKELDITPLTSQQINNIKRKHENTNFNERLSGSSFYMIAPFSSLS